MSARPAPGAGKRAWIALSMPPVAWLLFEYGLGLSLRGGCEAVGRWLGPLWGAASLLACAAAMAIAWPAARSGHEDRASGPWIARIAFFAAGIFALATGFQMLAILIVPSCAR